MHDYKNWNKVLCKEFCEYMDCFEEEPTVETLCIVEKLAKTIVKINEMEAYDAMRKYIEEEFGYDSDTGEFRDRKGYGDWQMYGYYNAYNPARMTRGTPYYPTTGRGDGMNGSQYGEYSTDKSMYPYSEYGWMNAYEGDRSRMSGQDRRYGDRDGRMGDGYMNADRERDRDRRDRRERNSRGRYMNMAEHHMEEKRKMKKLTEQERREWLENLENADGTTGPMWNKEQTTAIAKKLGIKFEDFTEADWNVAMNVMYSDYCEALEKASPNLNKPDVYGRLAKAFLEDEDGPEGAEKLSLYFKNIVEAEYND